MSGFNLPPGLSVSEIPGNRREDHLYEKFAQELPDWAWEELSKDTPLSQKINQAIWDKVEAVYPFDQASSDLNLDVYHMREEAGND